MDDAILSKLLEQEARAFELYERLQDVADAQFRRAAEARRKAQSFKARHFKLEVERPVRMEIA